MSNNEQPRYIGGLQPQPEQQRQSGLAGHWGPFHRRESLVAPPVPDEHSQNKIRKLEAELENFKTKYEQLMEDNRILLETNNGLIQVNEQMCNTPNGVLYTEARRVIEKKDKEIEDLKQQLLAEKIKTGADVIIERMILKHRQEDENKMNVRALVAPPVDSPRLPLDFQAVVGQWNNWDRKNTLVQGVDLSYFLFNPNGDQKIPQDVKKITRNMDVFNIMFQHFNPGSKLTREWSRLSPEEKGTWSKIKDAIKPLQDFQVAQGWINPSGRYMSRGRRMIKQEPED